MKRLSPILTSLFALLLSAAPAGAATTSLPARPVRVLCDALSTSNISRSGPQTLDTIALVAGQLACVVGESDNKNGAYIVQASTWRAVDPGIGTGLELYAKAGSANTNTVYGCDTTGAITWGTTSTVFTLKSNTGTAFNPASPGPIGGTTPAAITGTVVNATTELGASDIYLSAAAQGARASRQWFGGTADFALLGHKDPTGGTHYFGFVPTSGTVLVVEKVLAITLANNGTYDFDNGGYGGMFTVSAVGATTSIFAAGSIAKNSVTFTGGATYTNFSVTLTTGSKLNIGASGGKVRIENLTGVSADIVVRFVLFGSS